MSSLETTVRKKVRDILRDLDWLSVPDLVRAIEAVHSEAHQARSFVQGDVPLQTFINHYGFEIRSGWSYIENATSQRVVVDRIVSRPNGIDIRLTDGRTLSQDEIGGPAA